MPRSDRRPYQRHGADALVERARPFAMFCRHLHEGGATQECAMTSVSVVIPCYNYGHLLGDAVNSVLDDQDGVDVQVLIIDDASPDGSAEVARKIAAGDPRVEVAVHAANKGHIATYNEGLLDWAGGDYCVLLSADDRLTPGALQRAAGFSRRPPQRRIRLRKRAVVQGWGAAAAGSHQRARLVGVGLPAVARAPLPPGANGRFISGSRRAHAAPEAGRWI